jgi:amino acid transporter
MTSDPPIPDADSKVRLPRALGFGDLLFYLLITSFSIQSLPVVAGAGPGAVGIRLITCLTFFVPLVFCVVELSSRYPEEGGLYVWSQRAFGDFAGFMTGWMYWTCLGPFLPTIFYFIAGNALFVVGARFEHLSASPAYFITVSLLCLSLATMIPTFIPFLYLFAALIKLQNEPAGPEVTRVPGGKPVAIFVAALGFATTVMAIIFSVIPPEGANKGLAVTKVVGLSLILILSGVGVYAAGKRSSRHTEGPSH